MCYRCSKQKAKYHAIVTAPTSGAFACYFPAMSRITHLFRKLHSGETMNVEKEITLLAGSGIVGDTNANPRSPRQVLITRQEDLDRFAVLPGALRENIIISGLPEAKFIPGARIALGEDVVIRLTFHCEPCKIVTHLVKNPKELIHHRGILGVVIAGGTISLHDEVKSDRHYYEPYPDKPYDRFVQFMSQVPEGQTVTYAMILEGMGVAKGYGRAIPGYVKRAAEGFVTMPVIRKS